MKTTRKNMPAHKLVCAERVTECLNCGLKLAKSSMPEHLKLCLNPRKKRGGQHRRALTTEVSPEVSILENSENNCHNRRDTERMEDLNSKLTD